MKYNGVIARSRSKLKIAVLGVQALKCVLPEQEPGDDGNRYAQFAILLLEDVSRRSVRKMSAVADSSNDPLVEACKLLKVLNYFTKRIEAEPQEDWSTDVLQGTPSETKQISNRDSTMGKHAFAWGQMTNRVLVCSLMEVCEVLLARFRNEPRLLELDSPVHIMGGLTGNFKDVYCLEKLLWKNGLDWTAGNFLFLGGYVGEGQMVDEMAGGDCDSSLELISYLFANKARNPDTVHMIRGLHEIRSIQKENTFLTECKDKYGDEIGEGVWEGVNMVLDCMPLAAIVDKKIFCCSGGIPGPWICPTIQIIKSVVPCPLPKPQEQSLLAWQLMVNSPHRCEGMPVQALFPPLTFPQPTNFMQTQVRYRGRMVCLSSGQSLGSGRDPAVLLVTSRWHPPRIVTLHTTSLLPPLGLLEVPPEEEEEAYWPIDNGQVSLASSALGAPK
ncbi:hypothetical protein AAG570_000715 [Ranatra chinensis]|uniref:Serine/threonine specific protein phosphatases domain-containing protein n=1 Tax=Ranatra chinensis TaxID=642074 RepID=A0ABD0Z889_9HEMI